MKGHELKTRRRELGKTQEELADDIVVPVKTLRNWEQGVSPVPNWVGHHPKLEKK